MRWSISSAVQHLMLMISEICCRVQTFLPSFLPSFPFCRIWRWELSWAERSKTRRAEWNPLLTWYFFCTVSCFSLSLWRRTSSQNVSLTMENGVHLWRAGPQSHWVRAHLPWTWTWFSTVFTNSSKQKQTRKKVHTHDIFVTKSWLFRNYIDGTKLRLCRGNNQRIITELHTTNKFWYLSK